MKHLAVAFSCVNMNESILWVSLEKSQKKLKGLLKSINIDKLCIDDLKKELRKLNLQINESKICCMIKND